MQQRVAQHSEEVEAGERFEFGKNWGRFLRALNDERIELALRSLQNMLGMERLDGLSFLDVGSGSGLFSLVARRLGARVHSFDYDPRSVACTSELRRRYFPDDRDWVVEEGSALDDAYLRQLGTFDIVYSWGVLHHTGSMWKALDSVKVLVRDGGLLFIAIYNDLGEVTDTWARVKRRYNSLPRPLAALYALRIVAEEEWKSLRDGEPGRRWGRWLATWTDYDKISTRGMSRWRDWIDWIGGYPYERASVLQIVDVFARDGFALKNLADRSSGYGCNEFVFRREQPLGTFVDSRVPGGRSLVRRFGLRVVGPFERDGTGYRGRVPAASVSAPNKRFVLLRGDSVVGAVSIDERMRVPVPSADDRSPDGAFYVVEGVVSRPQVDFELVRGSMWSWHLPDLAAIADDTSDFKNASPVYLFEDRVQSPLPHTLHEDIAKLGGGRFSHWGRYLYFAPLSADPRVEKSRFCLVIATEGAPVDLRPPSE